MTDVGLIICRSTPCPQTAEIGHKWRSTVAIMLYEPTSAVVAEHVLPQWRMQLSSSATDIDLPQNGSAQRPA